MIQQLKNRIAIAGVLVAFSTACAPGFEANQSASCSTCANGISDIDGGTPSSDWNSVDLNGSINGGRFDQAKVIDIDPAAKMLIVRMPFIAGIAMTQQPATAIPEIPGATIGLEIKTDGSSEVVLRIPLAKVLKGIDSLPPSRLPNGEELPAIADGELPSLGFSFSRSGSLKGALYLSPSIVGVFVATKFDPYIRLTLPIRNEARTRTYGYFTSIPQKAGFDGGFFLSVAIPDDIARAIDNLL